jgi:hypothetical protein
MKTSKSIFLALLLVLLTLPLAAQVSDTYTVPAAANVAGAFGTRWLTSFSVFNPQLTYPLKVSVVFLPTGGGQAKEVLISVPANGTWYTDNALRDLYGINSGTGALLLATFPEDNPTVPNNVIARSFLVTTNTFNDASSGTYGQTIPGTFTGLQDVDTDGITAIAHGIKNLSSQGWRTNIGAVNLGRCSVTLFVSVYNQSGQTILNNAAFSVPPMGHVQDSLPVEVNGGSVEFVLQDACANDPSKSAVVFPYTSTIDQYSGDPTYQSPVLLASPKTLYGKKAVDTAALLSPGRRLTLDDLRAVRATATSLGEVSMSEVQ